MSGLAATDRPLTLGARQMLALAEVAPATLQGGPADLLLRLPHGELRFIATLGAGAAVLPGPEEAELLLRARRPLSLRPGVAAAAAELWFAALRQAATALVLEVEEPDALLAAIVENLSAEMAPEAGEGQEAAFRATLAGFGRLLRGRFRRAPAGTAHSPLALAAARLAALMGAKPVPVREEEDEPRAGYLERFAAAQGLRLRSLRLDADGGPEGDGPLLVFDADDVPHILQPRALGGYDLAPMHADGVPRRLRPADRARLKPAAFGFCRTLPAGRLTYRSLLGFGLKASVADFALLAACGVAGALLALLPPIASQQITNIAVHTADTRFLLQLLAALLVALVVETSFHAIGQLAELRAQGRAGLALHAAMVDRLLRLSPTDLRGSTTLILATEMETVEKFRRALIGFASTGLLALVHGLAAAVLVATISPPAGLVAIGFVLMLLGVTALIGWLQFKAIYEGERMDVIVLAFAYDLIRLMPVVRGSQLEKRAFTQWSENFLAFQARLMRSARMGNRLPVFEYLWDALVLAVCFATLAYAGASAHISAGEAVAFVMALSRVTRAGKSLSHALMGAAKLLPMAKLARPLLNFTVEPLVAGPPVANLTGRIDAAEVSFFYGTRRALDRVSFTIEDGEFVSIAGPSGSGKSTLLSLLAGLRQPQSGRLLLGGHDLSGLNRRQLTRKLGLVMQNSRLFPGSIYDNIRGTTEIDLDTAWHFAEQAGIADELRAMPMGLRTLVSEAGAGFALGQVQRILIARALAQSPAVLILDEAMSALDGQSQAKVMQTLRRLPLTRIIVAHRPAIWAQTDRVILLRDGALADAQPVPPSQPPAPSQHPVMP